MNFELLIDIQNLRREGKLIDVHLDFIYRKPCKIFCETHSIFFFNSAFHKIKSPFLKNRRRFPDFQAFTTYVDAVMDKEWGSRIAIINWSGDQTEHYIQTIKECHVDVSEAGMHQLA